MLPFTPCDTFATWNPDFLVRTPVHPPLGTKFPLASSRERVSERLSRSLVGLPEIESAQSTLRGSDVSEERKTELTGVVEVTDITKLVNERKLEAQPGDVIVVSEQLWDRCSKSDQLLFINSVSSEGFDHLVVSEILECPYVRHSGG